VGQRSTKISAPYMILKKTVQNRYRPIGEHPPYLVTLVQNPLNPYNEAYNVSQLFSVCITPN
jgi:hypothetical protein